MVFLKGIKRERGAILVIVGASLFALIGFCALVVDLGYIFVTKGELQNTVDAAALAAVVELPNGNDAASKQAIWFGEAHHVAKAPIEIESSDVFFGHYDISTQEFKLDANPTNAVQVQARRTEGAPSGPLTLFFATMFGHDVSNVRALSMAVLDPRVTGVHGKNRLIPYAVKEDLLDPDGDGDFNLGTVIRAPIENDTAGNFGYLDFDGGSNDIGELRDYIVNGFDGDFIIPVGGYIEVPGSPGVDGGALSPYFGEILGKVVFLPVHNFVSDPGGNNAFFRVVSIVAVRITKVKLTGSLHSRFFEFELIEFASSVLVVDPDGDENNSVFKPRLAL